MNPFFFGSGEHRLFGIYLAANPTAAARPSRAVVLCHPWGPEYQYAHRSMRHLANALSAAGIHVLRFDYFGTGDSDGDAHEAGLADWAADIDTAIEELQDTTGVTRVGLVGLRLGATLAAQVAANKQPLIDRLVLWDPVVCGESYLQELWQKSEQKTPARAAPHGGHEILGFPLTGELSRELLCANLPASLAGFPARALVIVSRLGALDERLRSLQTTQSSGSFAMEEVESPPVWHPVRGLGVGAIPVGLLHRIVDWLSR
jgi:pimeloyl-ACP methyl ester carboxylesterase